MKRLFSVILAVLSAAVLLAGCWGGENPPTVHVVHGGQLYEVEHYPSETTACDLTDAKLTDATIIPYNVMPSREGEINVNAQTAQICDWDDASFLVIIDGEQYIVNYH